MQGSKAVAMVAGAAPSLKRCSDLLDYGALYYSDLDVTDQRTALMQLYNSTGGDTWTQQLIGSAERQRFLQLVTELEDAGQGLANSSLTIASPFPTDLVTDLFNLPALSINCELQQWLSFGQLLLKFEWGSNVSYCRWYGVVCCKTSVRFSHPLHLIKTLCKHSSYAALHDAQLYHDVFMQGDLLNQYCSRPQSVAAVILPGRSLSVIITRR